MGSVQSEIVCDKCKFTNAMEEYYYKTGEVWIFCPRCGFSYSAFMKHDPAYGRKMKKLAEELVKEGKIDEALEKTFNTGWIKTEFVDGVKKEVPIAQWSDEEKKKVIKETYYDGYHKKEADGSYVWDVKRDGGFGAYHHQYKRGGGVGGHFANKWGAKKTIKQMIKSIKSPKRQGETILYTKKLMGKWYMFNARTGQKVELPDKMNFLLWIKRQNADFRDYKFCEICKGEGGKQVEIEKTPDEIAVKGVETGTTWEECKSCKGEGLIL